LQATTGISYFFETFISSSVTKFCFGMSSWYRSSKK